MTEHSYPSAFQRILEGLTVAVVTAVLTGLTTLAVLETRLEQVEKTQQEIKSEIAKMRDDLYRPYWPDETLD